MPKVTTVAAAAKDQGTCGKCGTKIKKGDPYRWWKFRYSPSKNKRCMAAACTPTSNDLTQSEWQHTVNDFQEQLGNLVSEFRDNMDDLPDVESLAADLDSLAEECNSKADEQEEKRDNMPESLQDSDTGNLLQERAEGLRSAAEEFERLATELRDVELVDVTDPTALKDFSESSDCDVDKEDFEDDDDPETSFMEAVREKAVELNHENVEELLGELDGVGFEG